jgi:uncharacterized protein (DUF433 family)
MIHHFNSCERRATSSTLADTPDKACFTFQRPECYTSPVNLNTLITVDPEILGGTPVFKGTRVPVKTLFEYLERNYSLEEFLECFPSVTREMACLVLSRSESALLSPAA